MRHQQTETRKVKCLVSSRLPSEYDASENECKIRLLLYSTNDTLLKEEGPVQGLPKDSNFIDSDGASAGSTFSSLPLPLNGPKEDFHLVMVFGDHFYSKHLERVEEGIDSAHLLNKRGATKWKNDLRYKHLWQEEEIHAFGHHHTTHSSGDVKRTKEEPPLVRIHSSCFTGETLGSLRCDCAEQLHTSISLMSAAGSGILLYLHQEGRGIGLLDKLFAYNLIDTGRYDTFSANLALGHGADEREYGVAALMLRDLGVDTCRLLTNNPDKMNQLTKYGINVVDRLSMVPQSWTLEEEEVALEKEIAAAAADEDTLSASDVLMMQKDASSSTSSDASNTSATPTSVVTQNSKPYQPSLKKKNQSRPLQDRDGYLLTKIKRMGHQLSVPAFLESLLTPGPVDDSTAATRINE